MSDRELELYRQHRTEQNKYTYFLLAAAASGIALAVRVTSDATLHWSLAPLGASVISWGLSFYYGCRHLQKGQDVTRANADLLKIQRGEHPLAGPEPWKQAASANIVADIMEREAAVAGQHYNRQFYLLVAGAILFVAWHVLTIVLRS
jgi:hypothetical protein